MAMFSVTSDPFMGDRRIFQRTGFRVLAWSSVGFFAGGLVVWLSSFGLLVGEWELLVTYLVAPLDSLELVVFVRLASLAGGLLASVASGVFALLSHKSSAKRGQ
ncbi:MAG: hypothetical protein SFZ23_04700 [Planctomycetota bacterium]|nr:hypothetical protein [Planctomycetota bacterium]